jgi:hypothetical protein
MLYKYSSFRIYVYFIIVFLNCLFAKCQQYTIEGSLMAQQMSGDISYLESDKSVSIQVKDFMAYGFQAGMNLRKLNMGIDFLFGSASVISQNNFEAKVSAFDADLEYSFLSKSISPLFIAGIGSVTYTDSFTSVESLNESDLSFNTGLGIKWKIADKFYLKPLYRITSSKIQGTTDKMLYHGFSISLGYIYTPKMFRNN